MMTSLKQVLVASILKTDRIQLMLLILAVVVCADNEIKATPGKSLHFEPIRVFYYVKRGLFLHLTKIWNNADV